MSHPIDLQHQASTAAASHPRRWLALALISVAQFMLILDITVVNVALPDMGAGLALDRSALTWVVTAYTLFFGGLMLLGGRLADVLGHRSMILTGLAVFTAASLASGLAQSAALLIGGRIGQGIGAALLSPAALATVTTMFHATERNRALGVWAALGGAGSAVGVLVGGALTAGPGWRWVFFINVPVGVALLATLPTVLPARPHHSSGRIDVPGALLATAGTGSLIYGLVRAGDTGWSDTVTLLALAAATLLYVAFTVVERRAAAPLMPISLLTRRPVLAGAVLMLIASGILIGLFFLGSFYLQHLRGYTPLATGLMFLPIAVGAGVGAHVASRAVGRIGGRPVAVIGLLSAAAGLLWLAQLTATASVYTMLLPGLTIAATGLGAVFVAATTTALSTVDHQQSGLASGLVNTFHELGGAVGVAALSAIAAAGLTDSQISGFTEAFWASTVTALVAAIAAALIMPGGRPAITGHIHMH